MKYLLLLFAAFVLVISMTYVIVDLDGVPEIIARIFRGLCFLAVAVTARKASLHFREARKEKAKTPEKG
jgi:hypothetical protein